MSWDINIAHAFFSSVEPSYIMDKNLMKDRDCNIVYPLDLNKYSIKRINKINIDNVNKKYEYLLHNFSVECHDANKKKYSVDYSDFYEAIEIDDDLEHEEIDKLLIHELIHNLHLDGSNYHNELKQIINQYKKTNIKS